MPNEERTHRLSSKLLQLILSHLEEDEQTEAADVICAAATVLAFAIKQCTKDPELETMRVFKTIADVMGLEAMLSTLPDPDIKRN